MDEDNDLEMRKVVHSANLWCERALSKRGLARKAIDALDRYQDALDAYHGGNYWMNEWRRSGLDNIDDLVECNV